MVERRGCEADEDLAVGRLRIRDVLVPEDVRPAVLVDPNRLHGQNPLMTAAELARAAEELGIDVIGAAPAEAYDETEQHIRERRERGLFAGMKFTMARPEVSCHPELLLDGEARTVVSAALCYWVDAPEPAPGEGRLPRYAWIDHYALLRERLDALGRLLGGRYRVLVDENQHVDREGARRAGVGFYGKNTMMITREHGSWVVLGTLVTDAEIEATPPLDLDCGRCRLCIDACPTGALDEPGVLDANRCLSFWTQAPAPVPEPYREELGASVYGCDICQDVCPWNRGVEKRRADRPLPADATPNVSLLEWLTGDGEELVDEVDRLYVPRNDPRWLRRNALTALGNVGGADDRRSQRHGWRATTRCSPRRPPGRSSGSGSARDERRPPDDLAVLVARDPEPRGGARRDRRCLSGADADARAQLLELARQRRVEHRAPARRGRRQIASNRARRCRPPGARCRRAATLASGLQRRLPGRRTISSSTATRERLRQPLDNLIGNAIGHSQDGGGTVTAARRGGVIASRSPTRETASRPPTSSACSSRASGSRTTDRARASGSPSCGRSRGRTGERSRSNRPLVRAATFRLVLPGASGAP